MPLEKCEPVIMKQAIFCIIREKKRAGAGWSVISSKVGMDFWRTTTRPNQCTDGKLTKTPKSVSKLEMENHYMAKFTRRMEITLHRMRRTHCCRHVIFVANDKVDRTRPLRVTLEIG